MQSYQLWSENSPPSTKVPAQLLSCTHNKVDILILYLVFNVLLPEGRGTFKTGRLFLLRPPKTWCLSLLAPPLSLFSLILQFPLRDVTHNNVDRSNVSTLALVRWARLFVQPICLVSFACKFSHTICVHSRSIFIEVGRRRWLLKWTWSLICIHKGIK
jgi:hypothetical protein